MATSDLYKMGRMLQLEQFKTRVNAAVLQYAATLNLGAPLTEPKNFAIWVLKNPQSEEISMLALVSADPTVLAQATIVDDLANVDAVSDASIKAAVAARWALVATKYPLPAPVV